MFRSLVLGASAFHFMASLNLAHADCPLVSGTEPDKIKVSDCICADRPEEINTFGQRGCSVVKKQFADNLKHRISHVIANYYEGTLLEQDLREGKPPFCVANDSTGAKIEVASPVCNIGDPRINAGVGEEHRNFLGQECRQRPSTGATPDADACFSTYDPKKYELPESSRTICGHEMYQFAQEMLVSLSEWVKKRQTGYQAMAAFLGDSSEVIKALKEEWREHLADNAEGFCRFESDPFDMTSCRKEMAWVRGMLPQLWQHHYEEVVREVSSTPGELKLLKMSNGARPCGMLAKEVVKLIKEQIGIETVNGELSTLWRKRSASLGTLSSEGCLKVDLKEAGQDAESAAREGIELGFSDSYLGANTTEDKHISQGFCQVAYARRYLEFLFEQLLTCEVMSRAKADYYAQYYNFDLFLDNIRENLVDNCKEHARSKASIWSCRAGCAMGHFRRCYRDGEWANGRSTCGGRNSHLDKPGGPKQIGGVIGIFRSVTRDIRVSNGLFDPAIGAFRKLKKPDGSDLNVGLCGLFMVPFWSRPRRKRFGPARQGVFLALLWALLASGCCWQKYICVFCFFLCEKGTPPPVDVTCPGSAAPVGKCPSIDGGKKSICKEGGTTRPGTSGAAESLTRQCKMEECMALESKKCPKPPPGPPNNPPPKPNPGFTALTGAKSVFDPDHPAAVLDSAPAPKDLRPPGSDTFGESEAKAELKEKGLDKGKPAPGGDKLGLVPPGTKIPEAGGGGAPTASPAGGLGAGSPLGSSADTRGEGAAGSTGDGLAATAGVRFESAGAKADGAPGGGTPFGAGFGLGEGPKEGSVGNVLFAKGAGEGGGGPAAASAGGEISAEAFEQLLSDNALLSLFEIVNRRYARWGNDIETEAAKARFQKLKH